MIIPLNLTDPQTPLYSNASGGLGNTSHLNGTNDPMVVRTVQHGLSNEAIIAITLGVCIIFTSWGIYYLTRRAERGLVRALH